METDNPFEKVLDRLREKGWCKNELGGKEGPNCLLGGFIQANIPCHVKESLRPILTEQYGDRMNHAKYISRFNNHPDTTFSDVERVMEKAAIQWEEERVLRND